MPSLLLGRHRRLRGGGLLLQKVLCVVLVSFAAVAAAAVAQFDSVSACDDSQNKSSFDAISCWLYKLRVHLPDEEFTGKLGLTHLQLTELTCTQFTVFGLNTTINETTTAPLIHLQLTNLSVYCSGHYHLTPWSGEIQMTVGANGADGAALDWTLDVSSRNLSSGGRLLVPDAVNTTSCHTDGLSVLKLDFSGSVSSNVIDWFRGPIANYVTSQLQHETCRSVSGVVDSLATRMIRQAMTWLEPYLKGQEEDEDSSSPAPLPKTVAELRRRLSHQNEADTISLQQGAPVLTNLLRTINWVTSKYLNQGPMPFIEQDEHESCGLLADGVNGLIRQVLAGNSGKLHISLGTLNPKWIVEVTNTSQLELGLQSVDLSRLDEWTTLQVLSPSDEDVWMTQLETPHLVVSANVSARMLNTNSSILEEWFQVTVNVSNWTALVPLNLELDANRWVYNLTVGDLVNGDNILNKLFSVVSALGLTQLDTSLFVDDVAVSKQQPVSSASLEHDLGYLVNRILAFALNTYSPLISASAHGLVEGPLKASINHWFQQQLMHDDTAMEVTQEQHQQWFNFSSNAAKFLYDWNDLLQSQLLPQVNDFIDCTPRVISHNVLNDTTSSGNRRRLQYQMSLGMPLTNAGADGAATVSQRRPVLYESTEDDSHSFMRPLLLLRDLMDLSTLDIQHAGSLNSLQVFKPLPDGLHLHSGFVYNGGNGTVSPPHLDLQGSIASILPLFDNVTFTLSLATNRPVVWTVGSLIHWNAVATQTEHVADLLAHAYCALRNVNELSWFDDTASGNAETSLLFWSLNVTIDRTTVAASSPVMLNLNGADFPLVDSGVREGLEWLTGAAISGVNLASKIAQERAAQLCPDHRPKTKPARRQNHGRQTGNHSSSNETSHNKGHKVQGDDASFQKSVFLVIGAFALLAQPILFIILSHNPDSEDDPPFQEECTLRQALLPPQTEERGFEQLLEPTMPPPLSATARVLERGAVSLMNDSAVVPLHVRHGLTILAFVTMAGLLASFVSLMATVDMNVQVLIGGETNSNSSLQVHEWSFSLYPVGMFQTPRGGHSDPMPFKLLVFLTSIALCSGAWPLFKHGLQLWLWIARPTTCMLPRRLVEDCCRGRRGCCGLQSSAFECLLRSNAYGKYAFVGVYVCLIFVVIFLYHFELVHDEDGANGRVAGNGGLESESSLAALFDVYVTPRFGIFALWIATSVSLLLGQLTLYYQGKQDYGLGDDRSIRSTTDRQQEETGVEAAVGADDVNDPLPISVCNYIFCINSTQRPVAPPSTTDDTAVSANQNGAVNGIPSSVNERTSFKREAQLSVCFLIVFGACGVASVMLLMFGLSHESFGFETAGLLGDLLLSDHSRHRTFSVVSFARALTQNTTTTSGMWLATTLIQLVFSLGCLAMPFVSLLLVLLLLVCPLQRERQYSLLIICCMAQAWASLEVWLLSVALVVFVISTLVRLFLRNYHCDSIVQALARHTTTGGRGMNSGGAECLSVRGFLLWGPTLVLLLGVVVYLTWMRLALRLAQDVVHERSSQRRGQANEDEHQEKVLRLAKKRMPLVEFFSRQLYYKSWAVIVAGSDEDDETTLASYQ